MTALKLRKWDSAQHLKTEEDMALYMEACLQEAGDDAAKALGTIARAKGMSQLSRVRAWAGKRPPHWAMSVDIGAVLWT